MSVSVLRYRGSVKHKRWRQGGVSGRSALAGRTRRRHRALPATPCSHPWERTRAHATLVESILEGGRRYATGEGIAFVAVPSGDGTWHGYPVPWQDVPRNVRDTFVNENRVTRRQTRRTVDKANIRWALGSDDD